jgi:hypothetical protein
MYDANIAHRNKLPSHGGIYLSVNYDSYHNFKV